MPDPRAQIRAKAASLGFNAVGFTTPDLGPQAAARLRDFLAAGHHGQMEWLADRADERAAPTTLWPEVRSVIALGLSYAPPHNPLANLARPEIGAISVYAQNRDYHAILKGKLKHLAQFLVSRFGGDVKVFVDTAPVMEKPLAEQAGLGWRGKHTNLVSRAHGSWLFLGEIYTTLALPPDTPHQNRCGTCTRCLQICPTNAFPAPYRLDARRCISYLTIEHDGPIAIPLREKLGNRIYGCDDCLAICPWNRFAQASHEAKLQPRPDLTAPTLADLSTLTDTTFREKFAANPIKRIGHARFLRNVLYAIGNSATQALRQSAAAHTTHPNPTVRDAATWALTRLTP